MITTVRRSTRRVRRGRRGNARSSVSRPSLLALGAWTKAWTSRFCPLCPSSSSSSIHGFAGAAGSSLLKSGVRSTKSSTVPQNQPFIDPRFRCRHRIVPGQRWCGRLRTGQRVPVHPISDFGRQERRGPIRAALASPSRRGIVHRSRRISLDSGSPTRFHGVRRQPVAAAAEMAVSSCRSPARRSPDSPH
jgi:hypothetical protein